MEWKFKIIDYIIVWVNIFVTTNDYIYIYYFVKWIVLSLVMIFYFLRCILCFGQDLRTDVDILAGDSVKFCKSSLFGILLIIVNKPPEGKTIEETRNCMIDNMMSKPTLKSKNVKIIIDNLALSQVPFLMKLRTVNISTYWSFDAEIT